MNTDTSAEAADKWFNEQKLDDCETYWFWEKHLREAWQECRRRCEAQMEEREQAHKEQYSEVCLQNDYLRKLIEELAHNLSRETGQYEPEVGQHYSLYSSLLATAFKAVKYAGANEVMNQEMEERERKAFEACILWLISEAWLIGDNPTSNEIEEAYRAFKEPQK